MKHKYVITIIVAVICISIISILYFNNTNEIFGIENYNKDYIIKKYGGDLDSNLTIFPNNIENLINPTIYYKLTTNLFDTDGYIILNSRYTADDFKNEINRLSNINMSILESCYESSREYINKVIYDNDSYDYPAYIAINGFGNTYEYALIDEEDYEITYVYLAYPNINNSRYNKYLKQDKKEYKDENTLNKYSIYNHSFDNGKSFAEFDDCKNNY